MTSCCVTHDVTSSALADSLPPAREGDGFISRPVGQRGSEQSRLWGAGLFRVSARELGQSSLPVPGDGPCSQTTPSSPCLRQLATSLGSSAGGLVVVSSVLRCPLFAGSAFGPFAAGRPTLPTPVWGVSRNRRMRRTPGTVREPVPARPWPGASWRGGAPTIRPGFPCPAPRRPGWPPKNAPSGGRRSWP